MPRSEAGSWAEFWPQALRVEVGLPPSTRPDRSFIDVLQARRSSIGGLVSFQQIADLLWYAAAPTPMGIGRAGLLVEHRPYPSAGGLHCIRLVVIDSDRREVALYEPIGHRFHVLDAPLALDANDAELEALIGARGGCTVRLIADLQKARAAYDAPESLLLRDAGCVIATLGLCAEFLGLTACPLGVLGGSITEILGFAPRFAGVGAVQICSQSELIGPVSIGVRR